MNNKKNIVITSENQGIGFGLLENLSKKHNVIFTACNKNLAKRYIAKIHEQKTEINYVIKDVNDFE